MGTELASEQFKGVGGGERYGYRTCLRAVQRCGVKHGHITQTSRREVASQVTEFISEAPMGVHETSIKEHLTNFTTVRHANKQKQNKSKCIQQKETNTNKISRIFKTKKN